MEITTTYYIGFLIIVILLAYVTFIYYKSGANNRMMPFEKEEGTLETPTIVLNSDDTRRMLFGQSGSSLAAYVFLKGVDKTTRADNEAPILFSIPGVMEFRYGFTADNSLGSNTELVVYTTNTSVVEPTREIISVPNFPAQKWIALTILRDGRRFDVLYNNKVVASKRLQYMPVYRSSSLTFGGPMVYGTFSQGRVFNYRMSLSDVRAELARTSNTRFASSTAPTPDSAGFLSPFDIFRCPGGVFCGKDTPSPKSPLQMWETPYA
jgi:hypothetical protein